MQFACKTTGTLHSKHFFFTSWTFVMRAIVSTLLFLTMQSCDVAGSGCRDDRDKDHRSRVSCVNHGLTALPGGIKPLTQVLVLTGNRFTSLSWSDYSAFTHLYELDLSHNDITALEPPGKTSQVTWAFGLDYYAWNEDKWIWSIEGFVWLQKRPSLCFLQVRCLRTWVCCVCQVTGWLVWVAGCSVALPVWWRFT